MILYMNEICPTTGKRMMTEEEADRALHLSHQTGNKKIRSNKREKIPKRKYFCHECDSYHLTSEDEKTFYQKRKKNENNKSRR